jgi:glycosyltransferase involved in cell wall biosynthesis
MHLLIITPIFEPTTGGAATYYALLTEGLLASGAVKKVTIITERVPGQSNKEQKNDGRLCIIRMFPHRAGRHLRRFQLYWRYSIQNFQYAFLPALVSRIRPDIMLAHSSLHIYPNVLHPLIPLFNRHFPVIADVRDQQLPISRLRQLEPYTALIACSLNAMLHIAHSSVLATKATHIPVIQEHINRDRPTLSETLIKYGLHNRRYLLFSGLIKQAKGVGLLLETFKELCVRGFDAELAIVGFSKDEGLMRQAMNTPRVRTVGALPREELLDLMSGSLMNINMSSSEGMPRTSLEALALGTKVLLPSGIPEFEQHCPGVVVRSSNHWDVANQIQSLLLYQNTGECYPIKTHDSREIIPRYIELFQSQVATFNKRRLK